MKSGFAGIVKPPGMTSSDAVVRVRRCFPKGTRVGHMGTLDPDALGVLPIGVGKAARLFDFVIEKDKEYIAEMVLGAVTDTQDASGVVLERSDVHVKERELRDVLARFTGEILQVPPAYSAVKKDGKRLYELARAGEEAIAEPRAARIDEIELLAFRGDRALLRVTCGRGTYIRTLLHDMGRELGCGAHMAYLVRRRAGPFAMEQCLSPERFAALCAAGEPPLLPLDLPLLHLPQARLGEDFAKAVTNGSALPEAFLPGLAEDAPARVYIKETFAGIVAKKEGALRWRAMLWEGKA